MLGIRIKPKEGMWINYQLRLRGITQQNLAEKLEVRQATVAQVITGRARSTRIENTLYQTLGYPSFEAMIAASRGHDGGAV
jgi:transcriptional regulator with XRE-family HTH domain